MDTQRERVYDILSDFADAAHREGRVYLDAAVDQVMAALTEPQGCEGVINEIRCDCGCGTMYACRVDLNGHGIQLCCTRCGKVVRWIPDTPKEGDTA